jgi:hypothetical protein
MSVPAWIDPDALPSDFAAHVDATPTVVATDGGVIDAGDEGEILAKEEGAPRPDGCDCGDWNADAELPCWPCYRDGFELPASAE